MVNTPANSFLGDGSAAESDDAPMPDTAPAEPQTSHLMSLQHEFQGHPSRGLTPARLAQILEAAEQGDMIAQAELFEDMEEKDGHLASEMVRRRRALTRLDWDIVPPPSPSRVERRNAEQLKELVGSLPDVEDIMFDTTDGIGKCFSCQEMEWGYVEKIHLPISITHRPQSWFRTVRGFRQQLRLRSTGIGDPLWPAGWITHVSKMKSGYLERSSLFRVLVWPYLFKNYAIADMAEFLEIYGIPLRLGKYPAGSGDLEKTTLLRALVGIGHNAAGIIPQGMEVDFEDAASGKAEEFEVMIDWCERTQSKVILGATLTSQAGRGSNTNALGEIHNEVRKDLTDSDAKQFASTWSRDLVYPIALFNGLAPDGRSRCPRFQFNLQEPEDLANYATALPALVNMGFKIRRQWAQEKLGIPEPEDGDTDLLVRAPVAAPPPGGIGAPKADVEPEAAARAILTALVRELGDPAAQMTDRAHIAIDPATGDWIGKIKALVDQATDMASLRDGLLALAPAMTLPQYTAAMQQALAAAALAGRYEILREAGSV